MALTLNPTTAGDTLAHELDWLTQVIIARIQLHLGQECAVKSVEKIPAPKLPPVATDAYARLVKHEKLGWPERLVLALALAPSLRPQALDFFFGNNFRDRPFTEFGGLKAKGHAGFLPTGETALFLLAGDDLVRRLPYQTTLWTDSPLATAHLVELSPAEPNEPPLSGALTVPPEALLTLLTTGEESRPHYSPGFPAQRITTPLAWKDLVLESYVRDQLEEICTWLDHQEEIMQNPHLSRHLKPGYRALFYGPPGTGKTLATTLLGKKTRHEVYRVDLSMIVSKYIGETEKNLARIFDTAARRRWILFFDEADALFGKRTTASSSNDRHANQETAYLLQRIEDFPGVIILASNLKGNLDEAFSRRFQAMIYFPMPGPTERLKLWQQVFAEAVEVAEEVKFAALAQKYEVAGGAIINVLRYCVLWQLERKQAVSLDDIMKGLQRELAKEGKTI